MLTMPKEHAKPVKIKQQRRTRYVKKNTALAASLRDAVDQVKGNADAAAEVAQDSPVPVPPAAPAGELPARASGANRLISSLPLMHLESQSVVGEACPWGKAAIAVATTLLCAKYLRGSRWNRMLIGLVASYSACEVARRMSGLLYRHVARQLVKKELELPGMAGCPDRDRTWLDTAGSFALWLKNAFNGSYSEHCRWEKYSQSEISSDADVRAPYQRGSKKEEDALSIATFIKVDPGFGPAFRIMAVPEIVSQTIIRLNNCGSLDSLKLSHTIASRISMLNVPKQVADMAFHGSAMIARAVVSQRRFQDVGNETSDSSMFLAASAFLPILGALPAASLSAQTLGFHCDTQCTLEVLIAPYVEETIKSALYCAGLTKASTLFGIGEYAYRALDERSTGVMLRGLPALLMHWAIEGKGFCTRVMLHQSFNGIVNVGRLAHEHKLKAGSLVPRLAEICGGWIGMAAVNSMSSRKIPGIASPGDGVLSCFGYRFGDRLVPYTETLPTPGVRVMKHSNFLEDIPRARMMVSLGPVVLGYCPPIPDRNHYPTVLHGVLNRFCSQPPPIDFELLAEFKSFVKKEVSLLPVVDPDADISETTWLAETHYPLWRQKQLIDDWDDCMRILSFADLDLEGFMKTETYLKFANPRGINSRSDRFKVAVGPLCKHMEHITYSHYHEFIKNVPVRSRPAHIMEHMGHCPSPYYETDYTAFERHFLPEVMDSCEMVLYEHLLHHFPEVYSLLKSAMCGLNRIRYKAFTICVLGRRMSGEMVTSLGNGFTNLMLAKFVAFKSGAHLTGFVEGDDGLFAASRPLDESLFEKLGFTIKIQHRESILESSFCGLMMSEDLISFTDPFIALCNLGWSTSPQAYQSERVRRELLRAKALSLLHEHPQCPMLSAIAVRLIEVTAAYHPRFNSGWYRWKLQGEIEASETETMLMARRGPSDVARDCFSKLYGVGPEMQRQFEEWTREWDGGPISHPAVEALAAGHASEAPFSEMWHDYVSTSQQI